MVVYQKALMKRSYLEKILQTCHMVVITGYVFGRTSTHPAMNILANHTNSSIKLKEGREK